jgi:hypothetical protein
MADERFDLSYTGLIAPGADPERARERLSAIFKLSDKGAERLFTGKPVIVKRNVDGATAEQFEKVFAHAGAVLTITRVEVTEQAEATAVAADSLDPPQVQGIDTSHLTLAPAPDPMNLEAPATTDFPDMDLSHLSLVPGDAWTLEDCEPPPTPIPELDTSYLILEPLPAGSDRESEPRAEQKPR